MKEKRVDWSTPEHQAKLRDAVQNWDNKSGEYLTSDPKMSIGVYARCVRIPKGTFYAYAQPNRSKRTAFGSRAGKPGLLKPNVQQFTVDVLRRRDRGNEGLTNRETAEIIHDMVPHLKLEQVTGALRKTLRPAYKKELTNIIKVQASTSKRSQITVPQQFRWHESVDQAIAFLKEKNTGLTPCGRGHSRKSWNTSCVVAMRRASWQVQAR